MFERSDHHLGVDRQVGEVQERAEAAERFATALESMRVVGRAPDGTSVTVTHTGALVAVSVPSSVPPQIAQSVMAAADDARQRIIDQVRAMTAEHLGEQTSQVFATAWNSALGGDQ